MDIENAKRIFKVKNEYSIHELKSTYRTLLLKHHPDKGGDAQTFIDINEAYKVLSETSNASHRDNSKRESTVNIFKSFLRKHIQSHLFTEYKDLYLTLEEMYHGKTIQINMVEYMDCPECTKEKCTECNSLGKVKKIVSIFGIQQKMFIECSSCNGFGYFRFCTKCDEGYIEKQNSHIVKIKKGCRQDDKYTLKKNDNSIVFVIKQYKHPRFKRYENDLILHKTISLYESISCEKIKCKHLNNQIYSFCTNSTIQYDTIYRLEGLGMPFKNEKNRYGDLFIKFEILIPPKCSLTNCEKQILRNIFDITKKSSSHDTQSIDMHMAYCNEQLLDTNLIRLIRLGN
jgi:DnaJ family protein A protein 2